MLARANGKQSENCTIFNRVGDVKIGQRRSCLFDREEDVVRNYQK